MRRYLGIEFGNPSDKARSLRHLAATAKSQNGSSKFEGSFVGIALQVLPANDMVPVVDAVNTVGGHGQSPTVGRAHRGSLCNVPRVSVLNLSADRRDLHLCRAMPCRRGAVQRTLPNT